MHISILRKGIMFLITTLSLFLGYTGYQQYHIGVNTHMEKPNSVLNDKAAFYDSVHAIDEAKYDRIDRGISIIILSSFIIAATYFVLYQYKNVSIYSFVYSLFILSIISFFGDSFFFYITEQNRGMYYWTGDSIGIGMTSQFFLGVIITSILFVIIHLLIKRMKKYEQKKVKKFHYFNITVLLTIVIFGYLFYGFLNTLFSGFYTSPSYFLEVFTLLSIFYLGILLYTILSYAFPKLMKK